MIELRWKRTAINPETAKAMGVDYSPDNWVILEDDIYAVLQYREGSRFAGDDPRTFEPIFDEPTDWIDVEISDD